MGAFVSDFAAGELEFMAAGDEPSVRRDMRGGIAAFLRYVAIARLYNAILLAIILIATVSTPGSVGAEAPVRILALGDSLVAGFGLPAREGFTPQLEAALRKLGIDARVIQGGVSGDTSAGGLARLSWMLSPKPAIVIVELGANDGLRGLPPDKTRSNIDA
ncbi:MAG: GDSL-type esterase/lipase family protein, partial [Alphaproteobacteria bacterium]|nr:GDSL-type esterase/lipase family protein [Alphaproteobacteria bacterium]